MENFLADYPLKATSETTGTGIKNSFICEHSCLEHYTRHYS